MERPGGYLEHFDTLGYILVGTTTFTWIMMYSIDKSIKIKLEKAKALHVSV